MSSVNDQKNPVRTPRWASRLEAMSYGRFGSTRFNELTHAKKIRAKKAGKTVVVDLNSIDDYLNALPDVGDEVAA
jgi:hypothetical protein